MLFDPYAYDLAHPAQRRTQLEAALPAEGTALLGVPADLRRLLRQGLMEAASSALDL
jgi:hypothetical protein